MELSLSLERLNYDKLLGLWSSMEQHADAQAVHFVEGMLEKQARKLLPSPTAGTLHSGWLLRARALWRCLALLAPRWTQLTSQKISNTGRFPFPVL
jgi:hypothetical protein